MFLHGDKSSKAGYQEYAEAATRQVGTTCLTFDLLGHGKSAGERGKLTINDHLAGALSAYAYLAEQPEVDERQRIGLVGASFGGYLAVMLTSILGPARLMLRAPAMYPDGIENLPREEYDMEALRNLRSDPAMFRQSNNMVQASLFPRPITIVKSEFDELIPATVIDGYKNAAQHPQLLEIKGAKHSLVDRERQIFKRYIIEFAARL